MAPGIFRSVMTSWWWLRWKRSQASSASLAVETAYDSLLQRPGQPGADVRLVVDDQDAERLRSLMAGRRSRRSGSRGGG